MTRTMLLLLGGLLGAIPAAAQQHVRRSTHRPEQRVVRSARGRSLSAPDHRLRRRQLQLRRAHRRQLVRGQQGGARVGEQLAAEAEHSQAGWRCRAARSIRSRAGDLGEARDRAEREHRRDDEHEQRAALEPVAPAAKRPWPWRRRHARTLVEHSGKRGPLCRICAFMRFFPPHRRAPTSGFARVGRSEAWNRGIEAGAARHRGRRSRRVGLLRRVRSAAVTHSSAGCTRTLVAGHGSLDRFVRHLRPGAIGCLEGRSTVP